MKNLVINRTCCNCQQPIDERVSTYSLEHFQFTLCIPCQKKMQDKWNAATKHALSLYFLLKKKGIRAELEKCDGFKTIDIAITEAKLNIEVDGSHHQARSGIGGPATNLLLVSKRVLYPSHSQFPRHESLDRNRRLRRQFCGTWPEEKSHIVLCKPMKERFGRSFHRNL
jgi:hypothetical protein